MKTRNEIIQKITDELKDLPFLVARTAAGDREEDIKWGHDDAMDRVAICINSLLRQANKNDWNSKSTYTSALDDLKKLLYFNGTIRELLTDETRSTTNESNTLNETDALFPAPNQTVK